jgi:hypothetical protein
LASADASCKKEVDGINRASRVLRVGVRTKNLSGYGGNERIKSVGSSKACQERQADTAKRIRPCDGQNIVIGGIEDWRTNA